jgi:YoeB-like toxin of bacterial type II toxin-antitoxin system
MSALASQSASRSVIACGVSAVPARRLALRSCFRSPTSAFQASRSQAIVTLRMNRADGWMSFSALVAARILDSPFRPFPAFARCRQAHSKTPPFSVSSRSSFAMSSHAPGGSGVISRRWSRSMKCTFGHSRSWIPHTVAPCHPSIMDRVCDDRARAGKAACQVKLIFADEAWEDYLFWQQQDKRMVKRINELTSATKRDPFVGIGKPERHSLAVKAWPIDDGDSLGDTEAELISAFADRHRWKES